MPSIVGAIKVVGDLSQEAIAFSLKDDCCVITHVLESKFEPCNVEVTSTVYSFWSEKLVE